MQLVELPQLFTRPDTFTQYLKFASILRNPGAMAADLFSISIPVPLLIGYQQPAKAAIRNHDGILCWTFINFTENL